jgi:hypothetical protein
MIWLFLLACGGATVPCVDNGQCSEGQACIAEACEDVDCLTSSECAIQQYCDSSYSCSTGCEQDTDCRAGETCNAVAAQCQTQACRSTELDCEVGQYCNESTGTCDSAQGYCDTCNPNNLFSCGNSGYCLSWNDPNVGYCWNYCDSQSDCPRGFDCYDPGLGSVCIADCPWLLENGYM